MAELLAEAVATVSRNEAVCIAGIVLAAAGAIFWAWCRMGDDD